MMTNENHRIRVLLVDDEQEFAGVLANRLTKRHFHVTKKFSGSEAIRMLRKNEFDIAVLDLKMEDMDGIEVLKIFKIIAPDMPVIMLTGHGSEDAPKNGFALGAFEYLNKPCDLEILIEKIHQALYQHTKLNGQLP